MTRGSEMIQCSECEHFKKGSGGHLSFKCDPFSNVKEPECLTKWQLLRTAELTQKVSRMVAAYEATLAIYKRIQPLQEKMFRHMEREVDDLEEGEAWKQSDDDSDEDVEGEDPESPWASSNK